MNATSKFLYISMLCGGLMVATAGAQTIIEDFEQYASDADIQAVWHSDVNATLTLSSYVAYHSRGSNSMRVAVSMPALAWQTTVITGPALPAPMSLAPTQYITLRIAGDPRFTNASYQQFFIYAWDGKGNFGRWGAAVPTTTITGWQIFNFPVSSITAPSDSPGLPDLTNIVQFKFYLYGQGDPAGAAFSATIYLDEFQVRDTPLTEFPPQSSIRAKVDDFEGYANSTALLGFYRYVNGAPTTVTTASLSTPAPQGANALKLAIDFGAGQWPWGSVCSGYVAPFALPTNTVVSFWFKGDPALAPVADDGTVLRLSFYDQGGNAIHFTTSAPVTSSEWTKVEAPFNQFWSSSIVDTGNLVQWQLLVEGWRGTPDSTPLSGNFYVDDIRGAFPPSLAVVHQGTDLQLLMNNLMPGTWYTLELTTNFAHPVMYNFPANSPSDTWPVLPEQKSGFFRLYYTP